MPDESCAAAAPIGPNQIYHRPNGVANLSSLKTAIGEIYSYYGKSTEPMAKYAEVEEVLPIIMGILDAQGKADEYKEELDKICDSWKDALTKYNSQAGLWKNPRIDLLMKVRIPLYNIAIKEGYLSFQQGNFLESGSRLVETNE